MKEIMKPTRDKRGCLSVRLYTTITYHSSLFQDMQICANELKTVMKNVLAKRKLTGKIGVIIRCTLLVNTNKLYFFSTDSDIKTEGFSLETCRSMIALMDVSFPLAKVEGCV